MTTQTEALKLALDEFENQREGLEEVGITDHSLNDLITAIKEALAQPEHEPVAWMIWINGHAGTFAIKREAQLEFQRRNEKYPDPDRKLLPLYTHPPVPTAQPKDFEDYCKTLHPLWNTRISRTEAEGFFHAGWLAAQPKEPEQEPVTKEMWKQAAEGALELASITTTPPQRKPLTDEEALNALDAAGVAMHERVTCAYELQIFRAAEAAYGIKEQS